MNRTIWIAFTSILFLVILAASTAAQNGGFGIRGSLGYDFGLGESYIDTHENKDIYWNPKSGFELDTGLRYDATPNFTARLDVGTLFGYTQYKTDDGGKVNTEAEAGNAPETTNTETSAVLSIVPMAIARFPLGLDITPYFGVGGGIFLMRSYEKWEFTNSKGKPVSLDIDKSYDPAPGFKGVVGAEYPIFENLSAFGEFKFTAVTFYMRQVVLTKYTVDGQDKTGDYSLQQRTYSYGRDMADENKGGEALLSGFTYQNYPQEKVGSGIALDFGVNYRF